MRIKWFFILLTLLLVSLSVMLVCYFNPVRPAYHYMVQGSVFLILVLLVVFYHRILKPMNTISNGMELLREQDFSSRLAEVGQYEADRLVGIFNRMMDQLKNERLRLREQNHFLDLLIQASPMGVIITSLDYDVTQVNPIAQRMLGVGLEQAQGRKLKDLPSPLAVQLAQVPIHNTAVVRLTDSNIYKCTHSSFIDQGFRHPFYLIERMTDEVMRAERKAYEKVIRMIAHEVNNTTAGITSTLDTLMQTLADDPAADDLCPVMQVCMDRCYGMSRFITRFADVVKIPEPVRTRTDLNELAATCVHFMESMCAARGIELRLCCATDLPSVQLDVALMEQVVVNIIKNAVESFDTVDTTGKLITVATLSPATIEVSNNGASISREVEEKLFTPFFSTKPNGQGIGLLFIREVLMRHGCVFSLRSYDDGFTRFRISF